MLFKNFIPFTIPVAIGYIHGKLLTRAFLSVQNITHIQALQTKKDEQKRTADRIEVFPAFGGIYTLFVPKNFNCQVTE